MQCPPALQAKHDALVKSRNTCPAGVGGAGSESTFTTNSACLLNSISKEMSLGYAQNLLIGDLFGGYLSFDM